MNIWQRIKAAIFNRYESARTTTAKSYIPGGLVDARIDISKSTREEIMRKARYFEKNNAIARRIGSVFCDFTVGSGGMVFMPASSDPAWNAKAKSYLDKTLSVIDLNSRQTFGSIQQLCAWRDFFDGDIFIVKTRGQDLQGRFFPRIQIFEAHLCKTPPARLGDEGKSIVDGVEIDSVGRPSGYWFLNNSNAEEFKLYDARNVIHLYDPDRAQQVRGISTLAAAINYLHRLDDLQELEFKAVTDAAEKSTFIKTLTGQLPPGMGGTLGKFRDTNLKADAPAVDNSINYREAIGGRMVALNMGEEPVQFQPTRPTEATRALWSYLTSSVCAACGVPKMICFSEWLEGAQGTIVRGDYDIAAQNFRARSGVYAAAFREVIIYVLQWGIQNERELADPPSDWANVSYTAPRAVNVDVGRNSSAVQNELKLGMTNYDLIYGALGLDARAEITRQIDFLAFVKKKCAEVSAREGVTIESGEVLGEVINATQPTDNQQVTA